MSHERTTEDYIPEWVYGIEYALNALETFWESLPEPGEDEEFLDLDFHVKSWMEYLRLVKKYRWDDRRK